MAEYLGEAVRERNEIIDVIERRKENGKEENGIEEWRENKKVSERKKMKAYHKEINSMRTIKSSLSSSLKMHAIKEKTCVGPTTISSIPFFHLFVRQNATTKIIN